MEHLLVSFFMLFSAVTWAPSTIAGSVVVEMGVNSALAWAEPSEEEVAESEEEGGVFGRIREAAANGAERVHEVGYAATRSTVEAIATVVTWVLVFVGCLVAAYVEFRIALRFAIAGMFETLGW